MSAITCVPGAALVNRRATTTNSRRVQCKAVSKGSKLSSKTVFQGASIKSYSKASRVSARKAVIVRAEVEEEVESSPSDDIVKTLQDKWDNTENKGSVALYGLCGLSLMWVSTTVVGAIDAVPVLPKVMELVGLGYSSWFVYRYLLFKENRKDLTEDVEALKRRIAGDEDTVSSD